MNQERPSFEEPQGEWSGEPGFEFLDHATVPEFLKQLCEKEFNRKVPAEYSHLIKGARFAKIDGALGDLAEGIYEASGISRNRSIDFNQLNSFGQEIISSFKQKHTIIDLAGGGMFGGTMRSWVEAAGAQRYLNVDIGVMERVERRDNVLEIHIKDDMLQFASTAPDETVETYILSGLEDDPRWHEAEQYLKKLMFEIQRSLTHDGRIVLGHHPNDDINRMFIGNFPTIAKPEGRYLERVLSKRP